MKKQILFMVAALGLLTACDPSKDSIDMPGNSSLTEQQLADGFTVVQYSDENYTTQAADGNYFTFFTSPSRVVTIYQMEEGGDQNILSSGTPNGKFKIVPKRGNPSQQTYYIETRDFNGNIITATKTANVFVPSELSPEMRLLASDSYGSKTWTWDTEWRGDGAVWGNMGYAAGDGDSWIVNGDGIWWGATPGDLTGQMQHTETGVATGEENADAKMVIYDDGNVICFDAGGNQIRKGKYSVEGWDGSTRKEVNGTPWSLGTLKTTAGSILFPFKINGGGTKPESFEILKLTSDQLILSYADAGTGSWSEATFWSFVSSSDGEAMLTDFGTKEWTWGENIPWDNNGTIVLGSWGNFGYTPGSGDTFPNGIWWSCPAAELTGQLQHSDTGVATGEEDPNAYMAFDWATGNVISYTAEGKEIRSGKFELKYDQNRQEVNGTPWNLGTLETDAGSILFPFKINGGGTKPTSFQIIKLSNDQMILTYADEGTGSWSEATFWSFKKK
jgi:hypothetical protein